MDEYIPTDEDIAELQAYYDSLEQEQQYYQDLENGNV